MRTMRRFARLVILSMIRVLLKREANAGIPIIVYHSVDDCVRSAYSISPQKFQRQIQYLKDAGYYSVPLRQIVAGKHVTCQGIREKPIVLSFDDGLKNFQTGVLPVLKRYGFSAVLSIVSDFCDRGIVNHGYEQPPSPALSWDEVRSITRQGVEICSHGVRHINLTSISEVEADFEIFESKQRIEAKLDLGVDVFCYPHGAFNAEIADHVRRFGYKAALTTMPGMVREGDNAYSLKRVPVSRDLSIMEFKALLTPAVDLYVAMLWGRVGRALGMGRRQIL